ncbi:putative thiazole-containing bacteriocin maturation protein [Bacillaceae bacterium Marseille-Q3522]|nr:putative thiazole-containing bacteriocin maturation protein [Bacillaceae bacterium Marseille-Q3522]
MANLTSSMRLKVKRDTFFLPDANNNVYFRNNLSSFRMEGNMINQWIEKLIPMFNGEFTLGDLTDGLPISYRDRVYEIAEVLYRNGFVSDMSQDRPHQLPDQIVKKYASQIEFLDSFGNSGAYRFQVFRQAKVLAVGSGPFIVSLVSALIESGLPKFQVLITDSVPTNRQRLMELVAKARQTDHEVAVEVVTLKKKGMSSWQEFVQPFHSILYVSQEGDIEELRVLHEICRKEKKVFLPAISLKQVGMAGPLVHPESMGCWESAWRRLHQTVLCKDRQFSGFSYTAEAMLANVIVFELFKEITGVAGPEQKNQFFLLDLDTLEGNWHSFLPHPLVNGRMNGEWVQDFDKRLERSLGRDKSGEILLFFSKLTSRETGIFHIWEEGDLTQLPLAQCRIQTVDPLSEGTAELLPDIVCSGLTHEETRREAGLTGIENYVSRLAGLLVTTLPPHQEAGIVEPREFIGVGAGEMFAEAVCRGLQKCLTEELNRQLDDLQHSVSLVQLSAVDDTRCRFYLQALTTMHGEPMIGFGKEVAGFPVVWVGTNGFWYGSASLNITIALQKALHLALMEAQNQAAYPVTQKLEASTVLLEETVPRILVIPECEEITKPEVLKSAMQVLERNRKRLFVFELAPEAFLKEELAGVFGVLLREEGTL